ncbi:MAG: hypothetical protein HYY45_04220 [Deltaproteobacteria bacterium]|nr:hypothetical protein [Deltaproteobacteria bacterium]
MTIQADILKAYFARWDNDLDRAKTLLSNQSYYLEAWLVLSCHIGALASLRFPTLHDNESYKRLVLNYSGMSDFYEQIDLLFFFQWPRSDFSSHGDFLKLKNHAQIAKKIEAAFGDENTISGGRRYVSCSDFLSVLKNSPFPGFDEQNLQQYLPLFSNLELLYRYVRCRAVHNVCFPFVTKVHLSGGGTRYEDNHAITGAVLYKTALGILNNLRSECVLKNIWPWEL